jgi:hypothetical protein
MAFPRGEEPSIDELRETSEFADDEGMGGGGDADGGVGPASGGALDRPPSAGSDDGIGGTPEHNLTQAVRQYRDELRTLKSERQADRSELAELRQWRAEVQRAIAAQRQEEQRRMAEAAANADPEPDPMLEPDKHDEWDRRQRAKELDGVRGELNQTRQELAAQRQQQIVQTLESQLDGFQQRFMQREEGRDYLQAYDFLVGQLASHYRRLGWADEQIFGEQGLLAQERDRFLRSCLEVHPSGQFRWSRDPAVALYAAAKQYGWGGTGQPVAPAAPAARQRRPSRAPALANAAAAAAGAGGGSAPTGAPLNAESLLNLSPREYAYLVATRPDLVEGILRSVS